MLGIDRAAQGHSGFPAPARLVQERARQRHQIGVATLQHGLRLGRLGDQAHRDGGQGRCFFDRFGQVHLVLGTNGNFLLRRDTARRDVHELRPGLLEQNGQLGGFFHRPAAVDPVGARDAHAQRAAKGLAHGFEHLQRKADAVFKRAAIRVGALVGNRRQKLVQQIAVRGVQLHRLDAQLLAAPGGVDEVGLDLRDVGQAQFGGRSFLRQVG